MPGRTCLVTMTLGTSGRAQVEIVANELGNRITPSWVAFTAGESRQVRVKMLPCTAMYAACRCSVACMSRLHV